MNRKKTTRLLTLLLSFLLLLSLFPAAAFATEDVKSPDTYLVLFMCETDGVKIEVRNSEGEVIASKSEDDAYSYELGEGSYTYSASLEGYVPIDGEEFSVPEDDKISVCMEQEEMSGGYVPVEDEECSAPEDDKISVCVEQEEMTAAKSLTALKGEKETAILPKLDSDKAFVKKFYVYDDTETPYTDGILDGIAPFNVSEDPEDIDYKDLAGNDENEHNLRVRTYDTVTYDLRYETATYSNMDYIKSGWLRYEFVLPCEPFQANWATSSMGWMGLKVNNADALETIDEQTSGFYVTEETRNGKTCQVITGKYWLAPNKGMEAVIPGEGSLTATVNVLNMKNGDFVKPSFSLWMDYNPDTAKKTLTPPQIEVSAIMRLNIRLGSPSQWDNIISNYSGDSNDPSASGYGSGTRIGRYWDVPIQVGATTSPKNGIKGSMLVDGKGTATFDIRVNSSVEVSSSEKYDLNDKEAAFFPFMISSFNNKTDCKGRSDSDGSNPSYGQSPYNSFEDPTWGSSYPHTDTNTCFNGGTWDYTVDPSDPNLIHVTVSNFEIDSNQVPRLAANNSTRPDMSMISTGYITGMLEEYQNGQHIFANPDNFGGKKLGKGTLYNSFEIENMHITLTDNKNQKHEYTEQSIETDDKRSASLYTEYSESGGGYGSWTSETWFSWYDSNNSNDTLNGSAYRAVGADPGGPGMKISIYQNSYYKSPIDPEIKPVAFPVAGKYLSKFNADAVTPEETNKFYNNTSSVYDITVLYAAKKDGTDWVDDDEMRSTQMEDLEYYTSVPTDKKCVGILTEYSEKTPGATKDAWKNGAYMQGIHNLIINDDAAGLFLLCYEHRMWTTKVISSPSEVSTLLGNNPDSPTVLPEADKKTSPFYDKGYIDIDTGLLHGSTQGWQGDSLNVVPIKLTNSINIAQIENSAVKTSFNMDSAQRFVDYVIQPKVEWLYDSELLLPQTEDLYVYVYANKQLTYLPGSAYIGGTYTQAKDSGNPGIVTDGEQIEFVGMSRPGEGGVPSSYGSPLWKFKVPNVTVGEPVAPIHMTFEIGTFGNEETDVKNNDSLTAYSIIGFASASSLRGNSVDSDDPNVSLRVTKLHSSSRSKTAERKFIETYQDLYWTIHAANNASNTIHDAVVFDALPQNGDGRSNFNGKLTVTALKIENLSNFTADNWHIFYTKTPNVTSVVSTDLAANDILAGSASVNGKNISFTEIPATDIDFSTGEITVPADADITGIATVGVLKPKEIMKITVGMTGDDLHQGDVVCNWLDNYPATIQVVKRSISGRIWLDMNKNGLQDSAENVFAGLTVSLYRLKEDGDASKTEDYEPATYLDGTSIPSITTGDDGRYEFQNLLPGVYDVRVTDGAKISIQHFVVSEKNVGSDQKIDCDAIGTFEKELLKCADVDQLTMPEASASTMTLDQKQTNIDFGLFAQFSVDYEWSGDVPSNVALPTDSTIYSWHDKPTADSTYTSSTSIVGTKDGVPGTYTFSGWDASEDTDLKEDGMEGNVTFKGIWSFTPQTYTVTYDWGTDVPSDVMLPVDNSSYIWHDSVVADDTYTSSSTLREEKNGVPGTWKFSGWTADDMLTEDGVEGDIVFAGKWTFVPDTYTVEYIVDGDKTYGIPADSETPIDPNVYDYRDLVKVANGLISSSKYATVNGKTIKGTWEFVGWDKDDFQITENTTVNGSWRFTPDKTPDQGSPNLPKTGDSSKLVLWFAILFMTGGVLVGLSVYGRKKRKKI